MITKLNPRDIYDVCRNTKKGYNVINSLDNDGTLGGTNEAEAGKRGAGQLALDGEMSSWAADLALSDLHAPNLKLTGVVDADLGLVGLLLDGEGLKALALAR